MKTKTLFQKFCDINTRIQGPQFPSPNRHKGRLKRPARLNWKHEAARDLEVFSYAKEIHRIDWGVGTEHEDNAYAIATHNAWAEGKPDFEYLASLTDNDIHDVIDSTIIEDCQEAKREEPDRANYLPTSLNWRIEQRRRERSSLALAYVRRRLGRDFEDLAEEIVHDALVLWIENEGRTIPFLCLKRTLKNTLRRLGLTQKIFTPMTLDLQLRLGRRETGLTIGDLPDALQTTAELKRQGFTYSEITEKLKKSPRDICEQFRQIGEFLNVKMIRKFRQKRIEIETDLSPVQEGIVAFVKQEPKKTAGTTYATQEQIEREEARRKENWNFIHGPQFTTKTVKVQTDDGKIELRETISRIG